MYACALKRRRLWVRMAYARSFGRRRSELAWLRQISLKRMILSGLISAASKFFVSDGISQGRQWGTFKRKKKGKRQAGGVYVGSLQRVCSSALPMVATKAEAQRMLNVWATAKGYKLLCVFGKRTGCLLESGLCCRFCVDDLCLSRCMQYLPCTWEGD